MNTLILATVIARSAKGGFYLTIIVFAILALGLLAFEVIRSRKHHDEILRRRGVEPPKEKR